MTYVLDITGAEHSGAAKNGLKANELLQGIAISLCIVSVYYYWFGIVDRNSLFLYYHYGWGPFHPMTEGRYWMTGFVLNSFITLFYLIFNFAVLKIKKLLKKKYYYPSWKHVWLVCQPAVIAGIPIIVMNVNFPVMPFSIAAVCVIASSASLALGLCTAETFFRNTKRFFITSLDGLALVLPLTFIMAIGLPSKGILTVSIALLLSAGSVIFSLGWLVITTFLYKWKEITPSKCSEIFISGLFFAYLVMPMLHYLFAAPPGNPYITTSDNFFPDSFYLKLLTWTIVFLIVFSISKFRTKFLALKHNIALNSNS